MCAPLNPDCDCHQRCSDPAVCQRLDVAGKGHAPYRTKDAQTAGACQWCRKSTDHNRARCHAAFVRTKSRDRRSTFLEEGTPVKRTVKAGDPNYDSEGLQYGAAW